MKYLELITLLKDTSLKHLEINSVGNGRRSELDESDNALYPATHFVSVAPTRALPTNGAFTKTYQVLLFVADLLHEDDRTPENIAQFLDKTDIIVQELIMRWVITESLRIEQVQSEEFIDEFAQGLIGWAVSFQIIFKVNPTSCDLPFSDL